MFANQLCEKLYNIFMTIFNTKAGVRNCIFLIASATKNFALVTRISQLVDSGRVTILCHNNYIYTNKID